MTFICDAPLHDKASFAGQYLVTNCRPIDGNFPWVEIELTDRTGTMNVCAENDALLNNCRGWTKLTAHINVSRNKYGQRRLVMASFYDIKRELNASLIPHSFCSHPHALMQLHQILENVIQHPPLIGFIDTLFDNADFTKQFLLASASYNCHHTERGGLFKHSIDVMQRAVWVTQEAQSDIERQAIIVAAFVHDVGKLALKLYPKGVFWNQDHRCLNALVLEKPMHYLSRQCQ